jgi:3-isopropylmalate/(R)-2-methylmalate dehydratase small subunit
VLPADVSERILRAVEADPAVEITIDIATKRVSVPSLDINIEFPLDNSTQDRFLNGLDDIAITLQHVDAITAFEATRPAWMPATNR